MFARTVLVFWCCLLCVWFGLRLSLLFLLWLLGVCVLFVFGYCGLLVWVGLREWFVCGRRFVGVVCVFLGCCFEFACGLVCCCVLGFCCFVDVGTWVGLCLLNVLVFLF